jgi:Flp pilus assembly protein TadD
MEGIPGAVLAEDAPTRTYTESVHSGLATSYRDQAILLSRQGLYAESEAYSREALRLRPDDVDTLNELGAALWWQRRYVEAEAIYRQADKLQPNDHRILTNLGLALYQQGRVDEAGDYYRRAIQIDLAAFDAHVNLGIVLSDQGKFDEADAWLTRAREQRPDSAEALQNLGMNLCRMGKSPEAIHHYEEALRHRPDHPEMHRNLAYALLTCGDYKRGWREYEWRLKCDPHPGYRINQTLWNGDDLDGRTILLHVEQGYGDTLQFIRFAPLVKRRGGHVLVVCQTLLLQLVARCDGVDLAFDESCYKPKCHFQAPLLSLPAIFGTTLDTLPAQIPYLATDPILVEHWRSEISRAIGLEGGECADALDQSNRAGGTKPFLIGIAWQGNPGHSDDRWRSFRLSHLASVAELSGVRLISLQTNHGLDQLESDGRSLRVVELPGRRRRDFMETAAIMMHLDLVITPDTAVAHLAGGLGRRVWVGLSTVGEWRWPADRDDSPWYPTARLFHQTTLGDWDGVFRRMATELNRELQGIPRDA